ncbi:agamous-like MADS-box protein AGL62 [Solanum stenotomum]|uniref:agamous-like MADS-box protein AGL62 n=1 Tax=Solanum stenotomum TaxID=172797 RepID=UPI0020D0814F|nr:agamous-like MADS-box protein AGL62 [Solanum stenotomum]
MARMQNQSNLQVTFSKRRDGVFKKATELSTLCGADVVVVVFSPSSKPYSCGHPSVESIMNRFLGENPPTDTDAPNPIVIAQQNANTDEINRKINRLEISLEREKKYGEALQASRPLDLRTEEENELHISPFYSIQKHFFALSSLWTGALVDTGREQACSAVSTQVAVDPKDPQLVHHAVLNIFSRCSVYNIIHRILKPAFALLLLTMSLLLRNS